MKLKLTPHLEIAIGSLFLAVGLAGPPLEPLRILIAIALAIIVWRSGKFVGGVSMLAVIAGGYAQHQQLRISVLAGGALIGIAAFAFYKRPRAATIIGAAGAVFGTAYLFLG